MDDSHRPPPGIFELGMPRQFRDAGFRGVLEHRVAMIALLRLLFTAEQLAGIDLQALRREPTRTSGPYLRQAEHAVIWSAPVVAPDWTGPPRVYFLIEVQSTVEATMPLRMLIYNTLLGLQLDSDFERPLPAMVPIVLYTEERRWDASADPAEMFGVWFPESLPRMRHYVLDLCRAEAEARSANVMALPALVLQGASEAAASTLSALLGSVRTESALEEVGTRLLTCETGDALIAKIRQM